MHSLVNRALGAALLVAVHGARAESGPFRASDFGAIPNDDQDDRGAIQSALNAAETAGGGTVTLEAGVYDIVVVVAYGLGGTSGSHGVLIPSGCGLTGAGMASTTLRLRAGSSDPNWVGNGIMNKGYQTATMDYGGGGNISISHLRLEASDVTRSSTGNLIGFAHLDGATVSFVAFGSSRYHGLEINRSRDVIAEDCLFDGEHTGSSTVQFDFGLIGAKSAIPTTTVVQDVVMRRCEFMGRGAEPGNAKVIELGHTNSSCILRNIAFEDCTIENMPHPASTCVSNDNPPAQEMTGLRFERCHFKGVQDEPAFHGFISLYLTETQKLDGLVVRDCRFTGAFTNGIVVITAAPTFNAGHSNRHGIVIEGNRFAPVLDRPVPTSGTWMRMVAVAACTDVTVRRNLFECPASSVNLQLDSYFAGVQVANSLDTRIEDNVFTWAHRSAAETPMGATRHLGINVPVYQLEAAGMKASMQVTGNVFLYPEDGINAALLMTTSVPTTSWAPGGPWVGGLVAGNFASGARSSTVWRVHHDLSAAGNIGQILPLDPTRSRDMGWYDCNGAALVSLDSGYHQLARVNGNRCGCNATLPSLSGKVIRLHGPLGGEGLLAGHLSRYADSVYEGSVDTPDELRSLPVTGLSQGRLYVVREPLRVYCWEPDADPATAPPSALEPSDKAPGGDGCWMPFDAGLALLEDEADSDGDGLSNLYECAFLFDPTVPQTPEIFTATRSADGTCAITFRCASGPHSARIRFQSSSDLTQWANESSSLNGGLFVAPAGGTLVENPWFTGREVTLTTTLSDRQFWRLLVEP